jgi:GNAT superfamily N-acetyltransferase
MHPPVLIRELNPQSPGEVELVARRMRETLVEVLGDDRGSGMYTLDWLKARVLWHLDPDQVKGQVFVAEDSEGAVVGHTIVRVDQEDEGGPVGLFSTTYVDPTARRAGVARALLRHGERWMEAQGMQTAVTYTDADNHKLQKLYTTNGYTMSPMPNQFVKLQRTLG